jgi:hypothetical protein
MPSTAQDAADALNELYNELMQKRIDLLLELDKIGREMDRLQLAIARIEENDPEA